MTEKELPFVSVIIPVFNNNDGLRRLFEGIAEQDYPCSRFEVLVVDNGSSSSPEEIAKANGALFREEKRFLKSPYSARNRGIEACKGEVIVLLDTTCKPSRSWISKGIEALSQGADLVGGDIVFEISEDSSAGELFDAISNVKMQESIENRGVAKGGNLFFRKDVLDDIGWFPEGLRSGGDVRWTYAAVKAGKKLVFSKDASVTIMPRSFYPLVRKQFRVAKGMPQIWREQRSLMSNFVKKVILGWVPPNYFRIIAELKKLSLELPFRKRLNVFMAAHCMRLVTAAGIIVGLLLRNKSQEKSS